MLILTNLCLCPCIRHTINSTRKRIFRRSQKTKIYTTGVLILLLLQDNSNKGNIKLVIIKKAALQTFRHLIIYVVFAKLFSHSLDTVLTYASQYCIQPYVIFPFVYTSTCCVHSYLYSQNNSSYLKSFGSLVMLTNVDIQPNI